MRRGLQMFRAILFKVSWSAVSLLLVLFFAKSWHKRHHHRAQLAAKPAASASHSVR